jgi:hypothetical protein
MFSILKIAVIRCWLDILLAALGMAAWLFSIHYAEQLLGGSSVGGFIADAILLTVAITLGVIALKRTLHAIAHEPRQLVVTLTSSQINAEGSSLRYEYHFGNDELVYVPIDAGKRIYADSRLSFWYRPIDVDKRPGMTTYRSPWGFEFPDS